MSLNTHPLSLSRHSEPKAKNLKKSFKMRPFASLRVTDGGAVRLSTLSLCGTLVGIDRKVGLS